MKLDKWLENRAQRRRAKQALMISIALTVVLYVIPFGRVLAYPLMLFSTFVHELGHGLAALATGGSFSHMFVFADGSGVAYNSGGGSDIARAIVSAGGLVGPAIIGGLAFAVGRNTKLSRVGLALFAGLGAVVMALFVRNTFGLVFTGLMVAGAGWIAWRQSAEVAQLTLVFIAIQMSLSVFSRGDYLFMEEAHTGAGVMPSDTAHMATALGGTYWMWGLACAAFSGLVLALGVWLFSRAFKTER